MQFQSKRNRTETEATQDKHVHLADELRRQNRARKRKRRILFACVVAVIIAYFAGVFSALLAFGEDLYESASIAWVTQAGYPVQTSISTLYQAEELSGGFVALGQESCVVYSAGGNRLRSVQSGYLRPSISVAGNRYLLYNRAGNELRVESRTQTLYTKTYANSILLATMGEKGNAAVVTESDRYLAQLTMYSSAMQETLNYSMTESEGIPIRLAYAPDSKTLAMATIAAQGGQMYAQIYLVSEKEGSVPLASARGATPLAMEWVSTTRLMVLYDDYVALYDTATQTEIASYYYQNKTVTDYDYYEGGLAILFRQGAHSSFVLLDADLSQTCEGTLSNLANEVVIDETRVYLVSERAVATYADTGSYVDTYQSEQKILSLLRARELLLFTANETSVFTPPLVVMEE